MQIDIIVPVLNEAAGIQAMLGPLQALRRAGHKIVVVDGGSQDQTLEACGNLADELLTSDPGRARQMNAGARKGCGEVLLFLHADTCLPEDVDARLGHFMASKYAWGRFDVVLSGSHSGFRVIERMMNWRSRLTGIATGDQAMFVRRDLFEKLGGFANIPLMEDVELSSRLRAQSKPYCIGSAVVTSSRRWEEKGICRTILLMWRLRLEYWLGVSPANLVKRYYK